MMKKYLAGFALSLMIMPVFALAAPGDIDPNTASNSACVSLNNDLRYKSRDANTGGDVSTFQDFLQSQGYLNSEPTGYFGILTLKAAKDFQKANGIEPTGYIGAITRGKISSLTCGTTTTTPQSTTTIQPQATAGGTAISTLPSGCTSFTKYNPTTGWPCGATTQTSLATSSGITINVIGFGYAGLNGTVNPTPFTVPANTNIALGGAGSPVGSTLNVSIGGTSISYSFPIQQNGASVDGTWNIGLGSFSAGSYPFTVRANSSAGSVLAMGTLTVVLDAATPNITISPTSGPVGTLVTISGSGFTPKGSSAVYFGKGDYFSFLDNGSLSGSLIDSQTIKFIIPSTLQSLKPGVVPIAVIPGTYEVGISASDSYKGSNIVNFTVLPITPAPAPIITSTSAKAAGNFEMDAGGTAIIYAQNIFPSDFTKSVLPSVFIGGIQAVVTQAYTTGSIDINVPSSLAAGRSYDMYILSAPGATSAGGIKSNTVSIKILSNMNMVNPTATIGADNGNVSYGGSTYIRWSCGNSTAGRVAYSNGSASGDFASGISGSKSTGVLTVSHTYNLICDGSNNTQVTASATVTVAATPTTPVITSLSPISGPIGTKVAINGSGFTSSNSISFNPSQYFPIVSGAASADGKTLIFTVPATLQPIMPACLTGMTCIQSMPVPVTPKGGYNVRVTNANGMSNALVFMVTGAVAVDSTKQMAGVFGAVGGLGSDGPSSQPQSESQPNFTYVWNNNLQIGSEYSADVVALQTALTKEGVYAGEITGGFYNQTFVGVKNFQQKYGIEATGFVGPLTRAKLNSIYAN